MTEIQMQKKTKLYHFPKKVGPNIYSKIEEAITVHIASVSSCGFRDMD